MDSEMSSTTAENIQARGQNGTSTPATTTISTIVLNSKPIQLVIALLQVR